MPREQLKALAADVDHLLVAGGGSISGDEGLRRREKALRDLGQKVPALAKVADVVAVAASAKPAAAPRALLDLLLVVGQVRAGLTTSGVEGTIEPAAPSGPWETGSPARDLYPIAGVLVRKGTGRMEPLKAAVGRPELGDLRLFDELLRNLDDTYPDFSEMVAAQILPAIGRAALPDLKDGLNLDGKAADARRLAAIAAIDREGGLALCRVAIAEGNATLKVRALEILAKSDPVEGEAIALGLLPPPAADERAAATAGKKAAKAAPRLEKPTRDAALACLGKSTRDEALEILIASLFEVDGVEVYGHSASHAYLPLLPHPGATARLLDELRRIADASRAALQGAPKGKGKAAATKAVEEAERRAGCLLTILGERGDPAAAPVLIELMAHPSGNLREGAAKALPKLGDPAGLEAAATLVDDPKRWPWGVEAAWLLPPGPRFERLAPLLNSLAEEGKKAREPGDTLLSKFMGESVYEGRRDDWDPRWADALRPLLGGRDGQRVALALEVVLGAGAIPDLIGALGLPDDEYATAFPIIQTLGRLRAREAVVPLCDLLARKPGTSWHIRRALKEIDDPSAIPALKATLGKVKGARKQELEDLLAELSPA